MARAGAVWISVLPDMAAFNTSIRAGLGGSMGPLGSKAGMDYGQGLGRGVKVGMSGVRAAVKAEADAAAAAVKEASAKVAAARDVEAKAAGNVRVAELKLQETRDSGKAQASTLAAAEERLATAERAQAAAAGKASAAAGLLTDSQKRAAEASDAAGVKFNGLASTAEKSGSRIASSMSEAGKAVLGLGALGVGVGLADFLVKGVKSAEDFQRQLTLLSTAGGEAKANLGLVGAGIETISKQTGTGLDQLSEGMYTLEKAGIRGASGLDVLRVAAEGAKAENVDLGTMTNALTSIMRSYNLPASDATQVTNELVTASGRAKTTMQEFAGSLSTVLPVASAAHISFAQVGGAIATLTQHGTSADEATQELANTIRSLQAPNAVASKAMAQLGIASNDVATNLGSRGLQGTITMLSQAILSKMGPSGTVLLSTFNASKIAAQDAQTEFNNLPKSVQTLASQFIQGSITLKDWNADVKGLAPAQANLAKQWATSENSATGFQQALKSGTPQAVTYTAELKAMMGGATGLNTALQLTGGSAKLFTANTDAIAASSQLAGKNIATWAATSQTFGVRLDQLKQTVMVAATQLGTALLPALTAVAGGLLHLVNGITGFVKIAKDLGGGTVLEFFLGYLAVTKAISVAQSAWVAASTLLPKLLEGMATALNGAKTEMVGLDAAMDSNPIGLVAAGITALVLVGKHFYDRWESNKQAVQNFTTAITDDSGALGANTRAAVANALGQGGVLKAATALGIPLSEVTDAVLGQKSAVADLTARHQAFATTVLNSASAVGEYGQAGTNEQASNAKSATAWQILTGAVNGTSKQIVDATAKAKAAATAQDQVAQATKKTVAPIQQAATASQIASANAAVLATDTAAVTAANQKLAAGLTALESALSTLTTNYFAVNAAQDTFQQDVNAMVTAQKSAKGALTGTSDASITYRQAIETTVGAVASQLDAEVKQHVSSTKILADYTAKRQALINELTQMGLNRQQIGYYVGALGKIPSLIKTDYTTPGSVAAAAQAKLVHDKLLDIPGKVEVEISLTQGNVYETLQKFAALGNIGNRSGQNSAQGLNQPAVPVHANGGFISGPGGPRDDLIPAMLSNGEFVVNAAATARHGAVLDAMNRNKFADGGLVKNWNLNLSATDLAKAVSTAESSASSFSGGAGVSQWAGLISSTLAALGLSPSLLGRVETQMQTESGGNPTVVNKWDSNWLAGHPSVGLMQVIAGTFAEYAGQYRNTGPFEYGVSTNPQANIYAGLNYAQARYGKGLGYLGEGHGYDSGGWLKSGTVGINSSGKPEAVLTSEQSKALVTLAKSITAGIGSGGISGGIGGGMWRPGASASSTPSTSSATSAIINPLKAIFSSVVAYLTQQLKAGLTGSQSTIKATIDNLVNSLTRDYARVGTDRAAAEKSVSSYTARLKALKDQLAALDPTAKNYTARQKELNVEISHEVQLLGNAQTTLKDLSKIPAGQQSAIIAIVSRDNARLTVLAKQRDTITAQLATANANLATDLSNKASYVSALQGSLASAAGLFNQPNTSTPTVTSTAAATLASPQGAGSAVWSGSGPVPAVLNPTATSSSSSTDTSDSSSATATPTLSGILTGGRQTLAGLLSFQKALNSLKAKGYAVSIIDQVAQAGVATGLPMAQALLSAGNADVKAVNATQAAITSATNSIAGQMGTNLYGTQIAQQQKLVDSLQSKLVPITQQMATIAANVQDSVSAALAAIGAKPAAGTRTSSSGAKKKVGTITGGIGKGSLTPPRGVVTPTPIKPKSDMSAGITNLIVQPKTAVMSVSDLEALINKVNAKGRLSRRS